MKNTFELIPPKIFEVNQPKAKIKDTIIAKDYEHAAYLFTRKHYDGKEDTIINKAVYLEIGERYSQVFKKFSFIVRFMEGQANRLETTINEIIEN